MISRKAVLLAASAFSLLSAPAVAQTGDAAAQAEPDTGLEEIVVTARKTEELLSDAPVAVTAFTAETLDDQNIRDLNDLSQFTPGLSFSQAFGRNTDRPVIRGNSNVLAGVQFGVESGTAVFVDGALFRGDIQTLNFDSLERVEVVKGPQSALYGRNTYAGAINFITRTPGNDFGGQVRARAAEFDEYEATGSLDVPLIPDRLAARIDARYFEYGGEYENTLTGKKVGTEESMSIAGTLYFTPNDNVDLRLRVQYSEDDDGPLALFLQPADANNCRPGFRSPAFRVGGTRVSTNQNQYFCGEIKARPDLVALNTDALPNGTGDGTAFDGVEVDRLFATANLDWDLGGSGWVVTAIGAFRDETEYFGTDSDHSDAFVRFGPPTAEPLFANTSRDDEKDYSIELRVASPEDAPIRGLAGVYYYDFENDGRDITFASGKAGVAPGGPGTDRSTLENFSVFGRVEADLLENLTIGVEGRYLDETKSLLERSATGTAVFPDYKTDDFIPRVTIDYEPSEDTLLYAIYAEGNKPGGLNGSAGAQINRPFYLDETSKGGEVGIKQSLLDNRLRVNLALYYNEISNQQLTTSVPNPGGAGALTSVATNQGNSEIKGFELEVQARPARELTFSLGYAYNDAKFTSGCDDFQYTLNTGGLRPTFDTENPNDAQLALCTIKGKRLPLGSKHQISGSLDWEDDLSTQLQYFANLNWSFESSKFVQVHNLAETGATFLVGARAGIGGENWELALFGRNLFDDDTIPLATRWFDLRHGFAPRVGGPAGIPPALVSQADTGLPRAFFAALRKSRTFGVEAKFRF
jgi:iron complex outermembrane recepter protein